MECNYCKRTEVCQGAPPEGCFLEHQIYESLTKEQKEEIKLAIKQTNSHSGKYKNFFSVLTKLKKYINTFF